MSTGSGTLTLDTVPSGLTLNAPLLSTGTINLTADTMALSAQVGGSAVNVGLANQINITPFSPNQPISLGTGAASGLALDQVEVLNIRAANVSIGNVNAGPLTVGAFTTPDVGLPTGLTLTTGSTATFNGAVNWLGQTTGTINAVGDIQFNSPLTASNPGSVLILNAGGTVSQSLTGTITVGTLRGSAGGAVNLNQSNRIAFLDGFSTTTGGANGAFTLRDVRDLTVSKSVSTGSGTLTPDTGPSGLTPNAPLLSTGTINLTADTMALSAQVGGSAVNVGLANRDQHHSLQPEPADQPRHRRGERVGARPSGGAQYPGGQRQYRER